MLASGNPSTEREEDGCLWMLVVDRLLRCSIDERCCSTLGQSVQLSLFLWFPLPTVVRSPLLLARTVVGKPKVFPFRGADPARRVVR